MNDEKEKIFTELNTARLRLVIDLSDLARALKRTRGSRPRSQESAEMMNSASLRVMFMTMDIGKRISDADVDRRYARLGWRGAVRSLERLWKAVNEVDTDVMERLQPIAYVVARRVHLMLTRYTGIKPFQVDMNLTATAGESSTRLDDISNRLSHFGVN